MILLIFALFTYCSTYQVNYTHISVFPITSTHHVFQKFTPNITGVITDIFIGVNTISRNARFSIYEGEYVAGKLLYMDIVNLTGTKTMKLNYGVEITNNTVYSFGCDSSYYMLVMYDEAVIWPYNGSSLAGTISNQLYITTLP